MCSVSSTQPWSVQDDIGGRLGSCGVRAQPLGWGRQLMDSARTLAGRSALVPQPSVCTNKDATAPGLEAKGGKQHAHDNHRVLGTGPLLIPAGVVAGWMVRVRCAGGGRSWTLRPVPSSPSPVALRRAHAPYRHSIWPKMPNLMPLARSVSSRPPGLRRNGASPRSRTARWTVVPARG